MVTESEVQLREAVNDHQTQPSVCCRLVVVCVSDRPPKNGEKSDKRVQCVGLCGDGQVDCAHAKGAGMDGPPLVD